MIELTPQQSEAITAEGKVIVSASAGSGKTFVMIQKLVAAIEGGVDLDSVLCVTFTKKAAAQMREKLRGALKDRLPKADGATRTRLKAQLNKVHSADISTIHSFCARLLRTYFYAAGLDIKTRDKEGKEIIEKQGVDGTFDIMASDDAQAREYKSRAISGLFENYYESGDEHFRTLLSCYRRKRNDGYLKTLILSSYEQLRIYSGYKELLDKVDGQYTDAGFEKVCAALNENAAEKYERLLAEVEEFERGFSHPRPEYAKILGEMKDTLKNAIHGDIFAPQCPLCTTRKPADKTDLEKKAGERFKEFKDGITARYKAVRGDISDRESEKQLFLKSGQVAKAFAAVVKDFEYEYNKIKLDENKLDYNDLEHLTCSLLSDGAIRREINSKYKCVFVDEYQDVNGVQEEIISRVGGENAFFVGDVKQAIYGFRGSKSLFFAEKYKSFKGGGGKALRLSNNFRSSDGVIDFVNALFTRIMNEQSCGFNYADGSIMLRGGGYPEGYGTAEIHVFGKDEEEESVSGIYSVTCGDNKVKYTREAVAAYNIAMRELKGKHFDLKKGEMVDTQAGDICILTRKRNKAAAAIVKIFEDNGYSVSGAQEENILTRPEVRQMLDILSYIDNKQQDIPLATALLSPLGGMTCDELAAVRVACKGAGRVAFRECCRRYIASNNDGIAIKLRAFRKRVEKLRDLAEVFSAAEIIDKILEETYLEAEYSKGGGEKLKNVRRLAAEGEKISVSALLAKLNSGYEICAPSDAGSDSIKIMTMHASKGLEFPVVIIADICATFKGRDSNELPLDEQFGFAPKCFDGENMLTYETVLRKLLKEKESAEELKNELNLFYVACTRAMCSLHILAEEAPPFNPAKAAAATSYAALFDVASFNPEQADGTKDWERAQDVPSQTTPDAELCDRISARFCVPYSAENSVNLPIKSSASAILKMDGEDDAKTYRLFGGEGETGTERGIAYHRFLELCDFDIRDGGGIEAELDSFLKGGLISQSQRELLDAGALQEILSIPVFSQLKGAKLFREQEFLCALPANEIMETDAEDKVLLQGAIDLLVKTDTGYRVIDYKYSKKDAVELKATYCRQLALYKKAVALITGTPLERIETVIINIFRKEQINL